MKKINEIAVARKAIKNAIKSGKICKEISGMHRIGIETLSPLCKNIEIASELGKCAAYDVLLGY